MDQNQMKKSENDFIFAKVLGEGSFSTVYLAKDFEGGKEYAIKVCDKMFITRMKKQKYIAREKAALLRLNNTTGIVRLAYSFQNPTHLFFVLTYANHGDLTAYIKFMNLKMAKFYAAELLIAIEGIHRKKVIHRDLKPQNCLLDKNMHLLVTDFGSAKLLDEEEKEIKSNNSESDEKHVRKASFVGTCLYVSPEILINKPAQYSSDLFSYGCIIYQLLCGFPPFGTDGETEYRIFQQIKNIHYTFPNNIDPNGRDLIKQLLKFDPDDRLGSGEIERPEQIYSSIRHHEFFDGINFYEIYNQRSPMFVPPELQNKNIRFRIPDNLERGFGERQLRRILQLELNLSSNSSSDESNSNSLKRIIDEQKNHPWSEYVEENEYIIKYGFINKRKGLFWRKRMFLLTSTPRLIYIDANANIKKGEIPLDETLKCKPMNFRLFDVITPGRAYHLQDLDDGAQEWCEAIENVRDKYLSRSKK